MKHIGRFLLTITCMSMLYADKQEVNSRSFMFTRPLDLNLAQRNHLWHNLLRNQDDKKSTGGAFQVTVLGQNSLPLSRTERYFLIDRKNSLSVIGDSATSTDVRGKRDIRAEWLGLPTDFHGEFSICPKQKQWGIIFEYLQHIRKYFPNTSLLRELWFGISLPIMHVENSINLTEDVVYHRGTGPINSIPDALNQKEWCFGKFNPKKTSKFRPTEVRFILGSNYEHSNTLELIYYSLLSIPTGRKPDPEFIFSPMVGNGGHIGWGGGVECNFLLTTCAPEKFGWYFFLALEGTLLVRNTQYRTFDLIKKPWSRYLRYNLENCPAKNIPGVNLLTLRVGSRPYSIIDFSMGWRFTFPSTEIELGYNVWGHGDERLHLTRPLKPSFGIAGTGNQLDMLNNLVGTTASKSSIKKLSTNDATFTRINADDIDFCSGAAQSAINHRLHVGFGWSCHGESSSGFIGGGFFGEITQKNRPLQLWGGWIKIGTSF